jgi:hypothetical protein
MSGGMDENGAGRWVGFFIRRLRRFSQIRILAPSETTTTKVSQGRQRRQVAENFLFFGETIANLGLGLTWG